MISFFVFLFFLSVSFRSFLFYFSFRPLFFLSFVAFFRPKDGKKEDISPHDYTIRNPSCSFHVRVYGDLSVSIRLAFPYECGAA